jgi:hypothetical protein
MLDRATFAVLLQFREVLQSNPAVADYICSLVWNEPPSDKMLILSPLVRDWITNLNKLSDAGREDLKKYIPNPQLPIRSNLPVMSDTDIARRYLTLRSWPINDLALLAGFLAAETSGEPGFKTSEVSAIFRQHDCDFSNVSSTLRSLCGETGKSSARLSKPDESGHFLITQAGHSRLREILRHYGDCTGEHDSAAEHEEASPREPKSPQS